MILAAFRDGLDPMIVDLGRIGLWWYGLAYAIGFAGVFVCCRARRRRLGWRVRDAYDFSILFTLCCVVGGRLVDVLVYERAYCLANPGQTPALWNGGLATHGVVLGGLAAVLVFSWWRRTAVLRLAELPAIPAAFFMALGRIGNHINGEVFGSVTDVAWAVTFPYAEGARHPVAMYAAGKNLLLIPLLWLVRRSGVTAEGRLAACFLIGWAGLRIVVDLWREYESVWLGLGTGQLLNIGTVLLGLAVLVLKPACFS